MNWEQGSPCVNVNVADSEKSYHMISLKVSQKAVDAHMVDHSKNDSGLKSGMMTMTSAGTGWARCAMNAMVA
jgi:hypothetical protein